MLHQQPRGRGENNKVEGNKTDHGFNVSDFWAVFIGCTHKITYEECDIFMGKLGSKIECWSLPRLKIMCIDFCVYLFVYLEQLWTESLRKLLHSYWAGLLVKDIAVWTKTIQRPNPLWSIIVWSPWHFLFLLQCSYTCHMLLLPSKTKVHQHFIQSSINSNTHSQ